MRNIMPQQAGSGRAPAREGSALVVVIWVVCLLSMIVTSFAFDAFVEARITSYYRSRTKAQYLARSGVEIAEMLMVRSQELKRKQSELTEESRWYASAQNLGQGLAVRGLVEPLGAGTITVDIVPEPARRNVNTLRTEEDWEHVLTVGDITENLGLWPVLIESFQDWTDADALPRKDGAETDDHYAMLKPPYRAKNGPLDTVEELLMIRGWTRVMLFGGVLDAGGQDDEPIRLSGIQDLLTTYGDGRVNVNAASARVLRTLPGIDEAAASLILEEREGFKDDKGEKVDTSFQSVADFFSRVPGLDSGVLSRYITTSSAIFRITSVGTVGRVKCSVSCIVSHDGKQMTVLRWWED